MKYKTIDTYQYVRDDARACLEIVEGIARSNLRKISLSEDRSALTQLLTDLDYDSIVETPEFTYSFIVQVIGFAYSDYARNFFGMLNEFNTRLGSVPGFRTASRTQQNNNRFLIANACEINALISFSQDVIDRKNQGMLILQDDIDFIIKKYQEVLSSTTDPETFNLLKGTQAIVMEALPEYLDSELKEAEITLNFSVPTTVLAYNLYDSLDFRQVIVDKNYKVIRHPGCIPAFKTIKVPVGS